MGQRRLDSVGDLIRHALRVLFECPGCGRRTSLSANEVMLAVGVSGGAGRSVDGLRGRCTGCGRRGVRAVIDPDSLMPDRPRPALRARGPGQAGTGEQ